MPRSGVPYPERVLCSLKNTIAMIEQKLGLKIEKVNGVGPDPSGNVTLVSGDDALTIEEDAAQHLVTIGLDRAELPGAEVTSVNGETGDVELGADEISDSYMGDVGTTLGDLYSGLTGVRQSVTQERTRAENAESTLQTNINASNLRISALEAEDADNMKLNENQTATGNNTFAGRLKATGNPTYTPSQPTDDVATIGTLDAYTPMVRTSGNQTISGEKTLNTWLTIRAGHDRANVKIHNSRFNDFTTSQSEAILQLFNDNDQYVAGLTIEQSSSNYRVVYLNIRKSDGTIKKVQLGNSS